MCSLPYLEPLAKCFRGLGNIISSFWWRCWAWKTKQLCRLGNEPSQDSDQVVSTSPRAVHSHRQGEGGAPDFPKSMPLRQVEQFCLFHSGQPHPVGLASTTSKTEKGWLQFQLFFKVNYALTTNAWHAKYSSWGSTKRHREAVSLGSPTIGRLSNIWAHACPHSSCRVGFPGLSLYDAERTPVPRNTPSVLPYASPSSSSPSKLGYINGALWMCSAFSSIKLEGWSLVSFISLSSSIS